MDSVSEKMQATLTISDTNACNERVAKPKGLLLDESGWEKSGKKSVGVARQYIGQVGKVAKQKSKWPEASNFGRCNGSNLVRLCSCGSST